MRVVHERAGAGRGEARDERIAWRDGGRQLRRRAAPSTHAVVVALELHAMPVYRCRFLERVDNRDRHGLALIEIERRAETRTGLQALTPPLAVSYTHLPA